jgi:hypothetical protein
LRFVSAGAVAAVRSPAGAVAGARANTATAMTPANAAAQTMSFLKSKPPVR